MENIIYPDYNNSAINTISSILKYYNKETIHTTNKYLDNELSKKYKNVVFMIFDGMGVDMLTKNLQEDSFLRRNIKQEVTAVYPSTTTAAMTTYTTGLTPIEHGWLGWSLYFKEFGRSIDLFSNNDSVTQAPVSKEHAALMFMNNNTIFDHIDKCTRSKVECYSIYPEGFPFPTKPNKHIVVKDPENIMQRVEALCRQPNEKFIMSYWPDPDHTMHKTGCYSKETKQTLKNINKKIELLSSTLTDTIIIISADHGLIDVSETININEYEDIFDALTIPPSMEPRGTTFFVKTHMIDKFRDIFNKHFENDFILYTRDEVFKMNMFGDGLAHKKVDDFVGDFLACGITDKLLKCKYVNSISKEDFKAHHSGITDKEMLIPIIVITRKD